MDKTTAVRTVRATFKAAFDSKRFRNFINELCNGFDEGKARPMRVPDAFAPHVKSCQRLGTFTSTEGEQADVLVVQLTDSFKLERSRTALRDFVAHKLKRGDSYKEAGLVAFVAPDAQSWRFSLVRMDYATRRNPDTGKIKLEERLTPARRHSYLVGLHEECHTAQSRFLALLQNTTDQPTLAQIEAAFSVESVTKEFFAEYVRLFEATHAALLALIDKDASLRAHFEARQVNPADFTKKLLGQIVFLTFVQKKGWLGVPKGGQWGDGPPDFLRQLATQAIASQQNLFNDVLEPLFYDTLATDRGAAAWCQPFQCRIPFLNGGLFEPLAGYDWKNTQITLPNSLFTNTDANKAGDTGSGILDVFDRYNFTVMEDEPLEKEVAIDPEMLGRVFENLIEENRRKGLGAFYTPREIVHYMCQESLINTLDTGLNHALQPIGIEQLQLGATPPLFVDSDEPPAPATGQLEFLEPASQVLVPRADLAQWIAQSEQFAHYAAAIAAGTHGDHYPKPPAAIRRYAREIDALLRNITVCDPAVGSGAFLVGMMNEIVRARLALTPYFTDQAERTAYHFKRRAIAHSLYGVDIDAGAVEIAKLRLWLSLVVDVEDVQTIRPLPNLDYKIVVGNSLLGVEKTLFNQDAFKKLELLKPQFFNASDRVAKLGFKKQIDALIHSLTQGREVFDYEIYFSEVFHGKGGFDVVIANPPYGADIDKLMPAYRIIYEDAIKNYAEIYKMFIQLGLRKIRPQGILVLITPNTFISQPRYKDVRKILTKLNILKIVNLGEKVFENVDVPTCLSFVARSLPNSTYLFSDLSKDSKFLGDLSKINFVKALLQQVLASSDLSLYVGKSLGSNQVLFGDALEIKDAGIQYHRSGIGLKNKGGNDLYERLFSSNLAKFKNSKPVWYGKLINRWFINSETDEYFNIDYRDILKSNESASFTRTAFDVKPKILWRQTASCLRATIDMDARWFRNTIQCAYISEKYLDKLDIYYVLGIVNSKFIEYTYNLLVKEAGRVFPQVKLTHVKKLPLLIASQDNQKDIADLVKHILLATKREAGADVSALITELDRLVYALYNLTPDEIALVEAAR